MSQIRSFADSDLPALVDLSLRAWTPVFSSLRKVLGDSIFWRLHPDWEAGQAEAVRASCTSSELEVYVAVLGDQPVGFVAVALNAYHERMGAIEIIAVDPDHQRKGVGSALTQHALGVMVQGGMGIAVVETGGEPGHAPARRTYEAAGFTLLPIARYFQLLQQDNT
jgi:GNAT superfamily N-acetyltransferase